MLFSQSCICIFVLLIFFTISGFASEIDKETIGRSKESPMDWSKPVVSRGFGDVVARSENEEVFVDQYKSGQVLYFFGEYQKAIEKWQPLVEHNFAEALASMGWLYQMGLGVKKNTRKAYELYLAAANQGNAVAQNNLGVMYENGFEVAIDNVRARYWYEKSAEKGYRFAQFNYANLLAAGIGGEKNVKRAIEWYEKSSKQNVQQAFEKLLILNPK